MARKEHQDILYAADMLEREIEELALKDNPQEAALAAKELIESGEYQRQPKDSTLIGELRDNVLSAICEVNALKNIILTKKDAEEQVMLEYLTASERELWHRFKESKAQKAHWETFMGNMKKPPATEPEALQTYEEIANGVAKKVQALDTSLHLMQPSIEELMSRLNSPGRKKSIQKAVHHLLMNDRPNRDKLKKANEHLDHAVEALRQVVFSEAIKEEHRKIFTTGQIYEILRRQYYAQKREYQKSLDKTTQLKKKVISQNRALSMTEDLYLKGARKKVRAELRRLQKQKGGCSVGRKPKEPSEFYGVWGRIREAFLKREHPAIYRHLVKSGELMEYLDGYQQAYSKRAATLDAELSKERGLTDDLMEHDALQWIVLAGQIHLEVLRRLELEIQR